MIRSSLLTVLFLVSAVGVGLAQTESPPLLQKPTLSRTQVAFAYAGDLWIVAREGGARGDAGERGSES